MRKPRTADQIRAQYELDILRDTVFRTRTKADTIRAAVKYVYDRTLAERLKNTSDTMR